MPEGLPPRFEVDHERTRINDDGRVVEFGTRSSWASVLDWATDGALKDEEGEWAVGTWKDETDELPDLFSQCPLGFMRERTKDELAVMANAATAEFNKSLEG